MRRFASLLAIACLGCAGHAADTLKPRSALDANRPSLALSHYNELLGVERAESDNFELDDDKVLFVLDRSMVLQQLEHYRLSSRDLQVADKRIEVLDFSRDTMDDIGRYLWSDDVGPYRAPAYEKLMINTMNMVNYLARGDLSGARVEARRLAVMQKFISEHEDPADAFGGPGSYLAGFVFEKSGNPDEALRFYDEALSYGYGESLAGPVRRVAERGSYRSPAINKLLESETTAADYEAPEDWGELLIFIHYGRVPAKVAKRVPIGLALTLASGYLSPHDVRRANRLAAQGLVTWVNYPELGEPRGQYGDPTVRVGGKAYGFDEVFAVDSEAKKAWEEVKGVVVASAITRMITRVAAGAVAGEATKKSGLGLLFSLGTQAAMTAFDTPDTRSWVTLPARIGLMRVLLPPGRHEVTLAARGQRRTHRFEMKPGGWKTLGLTVLR